MNALNLKNRCALLMAWGVSFLLTAGLSPLDAQNLDWGIGNYGVTGGFAQGKKLQLSADGGIISMGFAGSDVDMDPGPGTLFFSLGPGSNTYIQKVDTNGNLIWASNYNLNLKDIRTDGASNIYVTGRASDTVDVDPGPGVFTVYPGGVVLILDPSGNPVTCYTIGTGADTNPMALWVDAAGSFALTGYFDGTGDFDPTAGVTTFTSTMGNVFVLKMSAAGAMEWVVRTEGGTMGYIIPYAIKADSTGEFIITGGHNSTRDFEFGAGVTMLDAWADGFIFNLKLDALGNFAWAEGITMGAGTSHVNDLAVIGSTDFLVTGYFTGTADFDPGPGTYNLTATSSSGCLFLARYDASGALVWAKAIVGSSSSGKGLAVDAEDGIYVAGDFWNTVDLDMSPGSSFPVTAYISADLFFARYTSAGNFVWGVDVDGTHVDAATAIAVDALKHVVVTGTYSPYNDFDPGSLVTNLPCSADSLEGSFIVRYNQDSCMLSFTLDTLWGTDCSITTGYAEAIGLLGTPPYSYLWSTTPPTTTAAVTFPGGGIYSLSITDSVGCSITREILVPGVTAPTAIDLVAYGAFITSLRPLLGGVMLVSGHNDGCVPQSGDLRLVMDSRLNFAFSTPAPSYVSGDTVEWAFSGLAFGSPPIVPIVHFTTDSSVVLGDTLCVEVSMSPFTPDINPVNNIALRCRDVSNSYDPNYKEVFPAGECTQHFVTKGDELTYTIHFQNTGTAEALEVEVLDTLDTNLDLSTLRLLDHSHYVWTEIEDSHILHFHFDGIHLPDSSSDPIASQGWVTFGIHPLPGLPDGTIINNGSAIFFDSNPAVITNTVFNTLIDSIPPCSVIAVDPSLSTGDRLLLYPNPARDLFFVEAADRISSITVTNALGQVVYASSALQAGKAAISTSTWPGGLYFIRVQTASGALTARIVVE